MIKTISVTLALIFVTNGAPRTIDPRASWSTKSQCPHISGPEKSGTVTDGRIDEASGLGIVNIICQ